MSVAVWVLSAVLASACSSDSTEEPERRESVQPAAAVDAPPTADNPPYEIIGRDRSISGTRCSFYVRLEERVPESSIRNIAEEIKRREAEDCERTFIVHLLPGMEVDAGAWATSHFTPNLEVRILGMTVEQANDAPPVPDGEVVGRGVVARIVTGPHEAHRQDPHLPIRYDTGRPRAVIRLRISQPRTTSLPCPAGLRARRPSPMMDLYRKNVFSTRP